MPTLYPKEIETHSYDEILGNTLATELLKQVHMQIKENQFNQKRTQTSMKRTQTSTKRNEQTQTSMAVTKLTTDSSEHKLINSTSLPYMWLWQWQDSRTFSIGYWAFLPCPLILAGMEQNWGKKAYKMRASNALISVLVVFAHASLCCGPTGPLPGPRGIMVSWGIVISGVEKCHYIYNVRLKKLSNTLPRLLQEANSLWCPWPSQQTALAPWNIHRSQHKLHVKGSKV